MAARRGIPPPRPEAGAAASAGIRLRFILAAALAVLALVAASLPPDGASRIPAPERDRLERASVLDLGRGPAPTRARLLAEPARVPLGAASTAAWGGTYTTPSGETVQILVSDAYPRDDAVAQTWANFLGSLVHGPELARVQVYLAPFAEVQSVCGRFALACYFPAREQIYSIAEDVPGQPSAESTLAHEYGHHVARNRTNAPWNALTHGTKRWASYIRVCTRVRAGTLFPGGQGRRYALSPAEGFAEAYRVLNERRLGQAETPWQIVDRSLYPDATALRLLEQDVRAPWSGNVSVDRSGRFARGTSSRSFTVATPNDGALLVRLGAPAGATYRVVIVDRAGRPLGTGARTARATICGQRSVVVRVVRTGGTATARLTARLTISRP